MPRVPNQAANELATATASDSGIEVEVGAKEPGRLTIGTMLQVRFNRNPREQRFASLFLAKPLHTRFLPSRSRQHRAICKRREHYAGGRKKWVVIRITEGVGVGFVGVVGMTSRAAGTN